MTGGTRGGTLVPGEIGGGREGGGATAAGGERDIAPIFGKTTGEMDDVAAVTG